MVREPDATTQPTLQDNQLMSKHRVLSFKPQLRLECRGQDGQNETEQPNHSASSGDSITSSTRIRFSVHTTCKMRERVASGEMSGMLFNRPAIQFRQFGGRPKRATRRDPIARERRLAPAFDRL